MKKITAYVNTLRIHWLVEELETVGVKEIMVTEYFSPTSQISRMQLLCKDDCVGRIRSIIHKLGTMGAAGDHFIDVTEYDASNAPPFNATRMSVLDHEDKVNEHQVIRQTQGKNDEL